MEIITSNKVKLIRWLRGDPSILQHVQSGFLITGDEYSRLKNIQDPGDKTIKLLDTFINKGNSSCLAFLDLLKKNDVNESIPELREWITTVKTPDQSLKTDGAKTDSVAGARTDAQAQEAHVEERNMLIKTWNEKSSKWHQTLRRLLEDPDRQSIGNGKLFMASKEEYKIGIGAYGPVYLGMKADGTEVAIKQMIKGHSKELRNEMSMLRNPDLDNIHIVKYVDFVQDGDLNYLVLQLCEYDLDDYMRELHQKGEEERMEVLKKVARHVLLGLEVLHKADVIHRDIKPRNVLIDVKGNAKLADFGISRRLDNGASTRHTSRAGTEGWEATEILAAGNRHEGKCGYKKSADIQVAGMLMHYILSDGHHPFGKSPHVESNIAKWEYSLQIQHVEAKDLIEWMIKKDPEERPKINEVMVHPYFWDDDRRDTFLRKVGDMDCVQNYRNPDEQLRHAVVKSSQGTSFTGWKVKVPRDSRERPPAKDLPDDLLGLLRYLRNLLVHHSKIFEQHKNNMFKNLFPDFFICACKLAREMGCKLDYFKET